MSARSVRSRRWKALAFISTLGVVAVLAEEITVQVPVVDVRAGKGSMFEVVATYKQNDRLQILEHQPDGWLRVQAGVYQGYLTATALVPPKGGSLADAFKGMNVGNKEASDATASNAARGLTTEAGQYGNAKNLSHDGLEEMMSAAESVAGEQFFKFTREGNVGPR
jgi:hypothetical protein